MLDIQTAPAETTARRAPECSEQPTSERGSPRHRHLPAVGAAGRSRLNAPAHPRCGGTGRTERPDTDTYGFVATPRLSLTSSQ